MLVNYKGLHHKSVATAPDLVEVLEELYVNTMSCFPSESSNDAETEDEFVARIIGYLHTDAEPRSSSRSSSRSSGPAVKRVRNGNFQVKGVRFRAKTVDLIDTLKNRWELFVLLGRSSRSNVEASCLVHFNDVYGICEVHEVCVASPGKGLCKTLLTKVRDFIHDGHSGHVHQIMIYCQKTNPAACKCYSSIFANARVVTSPSSAITGYVYNLTDVRRT